MSPFRTHYPFTFRDTDGQIVTIKIPLDISPVSEPDRLRSSEPGFQYEIHESLRQVYDTYPTLQDDMEGATVLPGPGPVEVVANHSDIPSGLPCPAKTALSCASTLDVEDIDMADDHSNIYELLEQVEGLQSKSRSTCRQSTTGPRLELPGGKGGLLAQLSDAMSAAFASVTIDSDVANSPQLSKRKSRPDLRIDIPKGFEQENPIPTPYQQPGMEPPEYLESASASSWQFPEDATSTPGTSYSSVGSWAWDNSAVGPSPPEQAADPAICSCDLREEHQHRSWCPAWVAAAA